jgi:cytochrome P450
MEWGRVYRTRRFSALYVASGSWHPIAPAPMPTSAATSIQRAAAALRRGLNPAASRVAKRAGFPVLPGGFPVLGHLPATALDELRLLREAERTIGPCFYWHQGFGAWQLVCMLPEAFTFFRNKVTDSEYIREQAGIAELFGDGLLAHDGETHRHLRSAMQGSFQPKGLAEANVGDTVAGVVERRVRSWVKKGELRLLAETRDLALDVMFRLVGVDEQEIGEWRRDYEDLMLLAINVPKSVPGSPRNRGSRAKLRLDARLSRIIAHTRAKGANGEARGLLASLLASRDEDQNPLTERELVDNLRLVFLAGHETSATTMAWMVAHLSDRPDVWRRLRDEARAAPDLPRTPRALRDFPYAEAVFRETLRLHPPVARDARRAIVDFELAGRTVPRGTVLTIPILVLSRDPDLYPLPDEFRPERWLGRTDSPSPLEMVQFGGGPHFCLGYHLAWMELVAFAAALGRELPEGGPRLVGSFPKPVYFPLLHPDASTRARFD